MEEGESETFFNKLAGVFVPDVHALEYIFDVASNTAKAYQYVSGAGIGVLTPSNIKSSGAELGAEDYTKVRTTDSNVATLTT